MGQITVVVSLESIFCFHATGEDTVTTPYMWTIMFAIDGSNIQQNGNKLDGTPQYFFSSGSHGNLNSDISTGGTLEIPDAVGTWVTTLEPITITLSGTTVDVPGLIGVIYVLMDEHDTPNSDVEAGHQAFNTMVSSQFNQFISGIELDAVGVEVQDAMTEQGLDETDAINQVFMTMFQPVINVLTSYGQAEIFYSIFQAMGLGGEILTAIDGDQFQCSAFHYWTQTQLASTSAISIVHTPAVDYYPSQSTGPSPVMFRDNLFNPAETSGYYVDGGAWQPVAPIPEGVPAGRWQVTGVNVKWGEDRDHPYIHQIAGLLSDQSQWWLSRDNAVKLIQDGTNSFFVVGADGSQTDVILSDANHVGHEYLTTTPDASKEDNLLSLPSFEIGTFVVPPYGP